jgi:hypothetical protein
LQYYLCENQGLCLLERLFERGAGREVLLDGAGEEGAVRAPDGDEVVRGGGAGDLDQHGYVVAVPSLPQRALHQVRVPLRRVHRPQDHRLLRNQPAKLKRIIVRSDREMHCCLLYPEVDGDGAVAREPVAEAIEHGLPEEEGVGAAYRRPLRRRPVSQYANQGYLVRPPSCTKIITEMSGMQCATLDAAARNY